MAQATPKQDLAAALTPAARRALRAAFEHSTLLLYGRHWAAHWRGERFPAWLVNSLAARNFLAIVQTEGGYRCWLTREGRCALEAAELIDIEERNALARCWKGRADLQ